MKNLSNQDILKLTDDIKCALKYAYGIIRNVNGIIRMFKM